MIKNKCRKKKEKKKYQQNKISENSVCITEIKKNLTEKCSISVKKKMQRSTLLTSNS